MPDPDRPPPIPVNPFHPRSTPSAGLPSVPLVPPLFMNVPEKLVSWLLEELPAGVLEEVQKQFLVEKRKGYRAQIHPREKAIPLLAEVFKRNFAMRTRLVALWRQERKAEVKEWDQIPLDRWTADLAEPLRRWGVAPVYWYLLSHRVVQLQKLAVRVAQGEQREGGFLDPAGDQVRELRRQIESSGEQNKQLEAQLEYEKNLVRKLESEKNAAQAGARQVEKRLEAAAQRERELSAELAEFSQKLRRFSEAGHSVHDLEKSKRSLEHDLSQARSEAAELRDRLRDLERTVESKAAEEREVESILRRTFKALNENSKIPEPAGSGRTVLVIGKRESLPAAYYQKAGEKGWVLLYQGGFKKDEDLERKIGKSELVLVLLDRWEDFSSHKDLIGFLEKKGANCAVAPALSPDLLLRWLEAGRGEYGSPRT